LEQTRLKRSKVTVDINCSPTFGRSLTTKGCFVTPGDLAFLKQFL
jgi:hypothetical protein